MRHILVVGSATIDVIEHSGATTLKMGGVVTYGGITFRQHGLPTTVLCNIAPQDARLREVLGRHGIMVESGITPVTTRFVNRVDGDRRRQEMPVQANPLMADQWRRLAPRINHLHLGPLHPQDIDTALLTAIAAAPMCVTLDVQGYTRRIANGHVTAGACADLPAALSISQVIKADREELEAVTDYLRMTPHELMRVYPLREIVVTAGYQGGSILLPSGDAIDYAAPRVAHVADPTGAGDVFFASYLAWRLHQGQSIDASCRHAALIAAQHVQGQYIPGGSLRLDTVVSAQTPCQSRNTGRNV